MFKNLECLRDASLAPAKLCFFFFASLHLRGADDGAAREEERHARGEIEGAREPHLRMHVELRPAGRVKPLDDGSGDCAARVPRYSRVPRTAHFRLCCLLALDPAAAAAR